jgi:hypothetical protein
VAKLEALERSLALNYEHTAFFGATGGCATGAITDAYSGAGGRVGGLDIMAPIMENTTPLRHERDNPLRSVSGCGYKLTELCCYVLTLFGDTSHRASALPLTRALDSQSRLPVESPKQEKHNQ